MQTATLPPRPTLRQQAKADRDYAAEQLVYWRRQSAVRTQPAAIAEAKGLQAAWKYNLEQRQAKLDALNSKH
jgi:hypothetical protein